jgi:hypothetical protein
LTQFKPTFQGAAFIAGRSAASRLQLKSVCEHLIGRRYEYGGDDCIHLDWYRLNPRGILRELSVYCDTLDAPIYDGDIILFGAKPPEFGVQWQSGILFINHLISAVDWKPVASFTIRRSYRMKSR